MESVGQADRGARLEAGGVEDDQVAAVGAGVVDEPHEYPVVLGRPRSVRDEDELADALVGAQPPSGGPSLAQVVLEHRVAGAASGAGRLHGVPVTVRSADEPVIDAREFLRGSSRRVSRTLPSARSTVQGAVEVAGTNSVQVVGELVVGIPAFDQRESATGVAEHVGVGPDYLQPRPVGGVAWRGLAERASHGGRADPAVAVPLTHPAQRGSCRWRLSASEPTSPSPGARPLGIAHYVPFGASTSDAWSPVLGIRPLTPKRNATYPGMRSGPIPLRGVRALHRSLCKSRCRRALRSLTVRS